MPGAFVPNRNFIREIVKDPEYRDNMRAKAEEIRDDAAALMPRGEDERLGHLADKFEAGEDEYGAWVGNSETTPTKNPDITVYHLAEFGSVKNPPYAPLRKAAIRAGLDLGPFAP